jgi:UDP-N-acetylmuramoylalanine--D-glutamate ligase
MNIAILGYAREGRSSYEYWNKAGNTITICDQDPSLSFPDDTEICTGHDYLENLYRFDLIVRSPVFPPSKIVAENSEDVLGKVTTNNNEFFKVCPTKNIIGVTGTKGKGTTVTLIAKMLENMGHRVHVGGNIGTPSLDLLKNNIAKDDYVVLELSSFQLVDLKYSPHVAVCLMVVFEHLDWHGDMDEYTLAKRQLFAHQGSYDIAVYYAENENSKAIASWGDGKKIPFFEEPGALVFDNLVKIDDQVICNVEELKLTGEHNWQNVCAAITAVWQVDKDVEKIRQTVINFENLENRLELVRVFNDVTFYNDSFAANPGATSAAIKAIKGKKVLIIGGFDRNLPLDDLTDTISDHKDEIVQILLIGASAKRVAKELEKATVSNYQILESKDITDIVKNAYERAGTSQSVVFSPGFPSFDMFKDFEERGKQYKAAVNSL